MVEVRVIIPTYNREFVIRDALDSVRAQTFGDIEIVVADDGSEDDTVETVNVYARSDSRIRLLQLVHVGAAGARNAAIEFAGMHRYVAFLDSDDLWMPGHLARAIRVLEKFPEASVYFSAVQVDDIGGIWTAERLEHYRKTMLKPALISTSLLENDLHWLDAMTIRGAFLRGEFYPQVPSVVVRASAIERQPWFRTDLRVLEDCEFFLAAAANGRNFVFDEQVHVRVRRHGDNLSGTADLFSERAAKSLVSGVRFQESKLALCKSSDEVSYVKGEVARAAYLLGQNRSECLDMRGARAAYRVALRHKMGYKAIKGLLAATLPPRAFSQVRAAIRRRK